LNLSESSDAKDPYWQIRHQLVEEHIAPAGVTDGRVLHSIRNTPRHEFVPDELRERAYLDMSLPIGESQTISSPFTVALMTETLGLSDGDRVLEIGTGSGYQAAVLSPLVTHVYSIEIVPELSQRAASVLSRLKYQNVSTRVGDGFSGWAEAAPFDRIIVTCSPEAVPEALVDQLREGGTLIIPVGERYQQTLFRMIKQNGRLVREALRPTLFVPMTGEAEEDRQWLPDAGNPRVVNGDFETSAEREFECFPNHVPGWYYGRQVSLVQGNPQEPAAVGKTFVRFTNQIPGLSSHLLQGIPVDGTRVRRLRLSGLARIMEVRRGPEKDAAPMISITLYDASRSEVGLFWLGPFDNSQSWQAEQRVMDIPETSREAILRVGLFGATGKADFDDIRLEKVT